MMFWYFWGGIQVSACVVACVVFGPHHITATNISAVCTVPVFELMHLTLSYFLGKMFCLA